MNTPAPITTSTSTIDTLRSLRKALYKRIDRQHYLEKRRIQRDSGSTRKGTSFVDPTHYATRITQLKLDAKSLTHQIKLLRSTLTQHKQAS